MKDYTEQLLEIADSRIKLANKYAKERKAYGDLKAKIDIALAAKLLTLMEKRKTLGYETATLMLISEKPELADSYQLMIQALNNFKAIERMIDAHDSKTMAIQSIMKYNSVNDGGY
jgi:hypothetical protein